MRERCAHPKTGGRQISMLMMMLMLMLIPTFKFRLLYMSTLSWVMIFDSGGHSDGRRPPAYMGAESNEGRLK